MNANCKKLKAKPSPTFSKVGHDFYVMQAELKFNSVGKIRGIAHCTCGWKSPMTWNTMSYCYKNWFLDHLEVKTEEAKSIKDPYILVSVKEYLSQGN